MSLWATKSISVLRAEAAEAGIAHAMTNLGVLLHERGEVEGLKYVISGGGGAPLYRQHREEPTVMRFEAS